MNNHHTPAPIEKKLFTPGVIFLLILMANGGFFLLMRFIFGLGRVTNLDNYYAWGIWITIDVVCGVALAAGGFTTAALVEIFHRTDYHILLRPALLTAMLGYTFVGIGVLVDLGRYYNIWHPMLPSMWSGHSALFEVAMCVMTYVTVLYLEFVPVVIERFKGRVDLPGPLSALNAPLELILKLLEKTVMRVMFIFAIMGVVLSFMHQSSLGALLVLAPSKMHALWYSPILPLLFLLSAISVGYPMVIIESIIASKSFGRKPEMPVLSKFARFIPIFLGLYGLAKITDLAVRDQLGVLFNGSFKSNLCILEICLGILIPLGLFLNERARNNPIILFTAAGLVLGGLVFNRINVYLVAFRPPYAHHVYYPSFGEISVTVGFIAAIMFLYRVFVTIFPIIASDGMKGTTHAKV